MVFNLTNKDSIKILAESPLALVDPKGNLSFTQLGFLALQKCELRRSRSWDPQLSDIQMRIKALMGANSEIFQAMQTKYKMYSHVEASCRRNKAGYQVQKKALYVDSTSHITSFTSRATSHKLENSLRQLRVQSIAVG